MIQVLVHHQVADYNSWRSVFDAALDFRHNGGECTCRIFRKAGNPNDLTLLFDWEDVERAKHFMSSTNYARKCARPESSAYLKFNIWRKCIRCDAAQRTESPNGSDAQAGQRYERA